MPLLAESQFNSVYFLFGNNVTDSVLFFLFNSRVLKWADANYDTLYYSFTIGQRMLRGVIIFTANFYGSI